MSDQPKPTGEWTVEPVKRSDGTLWPGLAYIAQSNGKVFGAFNEQQAIHLVAAINAALAAEREKRDTAECNRSGFELENYGLKDQLAAEREKVQALRQRMAEIDIKTKALKRALEHLQQLRDQLAITTSEEHRLRALLDLPGHELRKQLAEAQAELDRLCKIYPWAVRLDTTALDAAIAAAQQPLVDALKDIASTLGTEISKRAKAKDALVKVKVSK